jgi:hypothetical protein
VKPACVDCAQRAPGSKTGMFNPACFACGVAYLRQLRTLAITPKALAARTEHVLDTWAGCGHDRDALLAAARRAT